VDVQNVGTLFFQVKEDGCRWQAFDSKNQHSEHEQETARVIKTGYSLPCHHPFVHSPFKISECPISFRDQATALQN